MREIINMFMIKFICLFIPNKNLRRKLRGNIKRIKQIEYYKKIQTRYKKILKKLRSQKRSATKIKVVFIVTRSQVWGAQSIYNELSKSKIIEICAVVLPTMRENGKVFENYHENISFLKNKNINFIEGFNVKDKSYISLKEIRPDIVFLDTPYEEILPKEFRIDKISKYSLTCYIPYGFMIPDTPKINFNHSFHNKCWKIFCETDIHKILFKEHSDIKAINVVSLGYPKFDDFKLLKADENAPWKLKQNKDSVKRIIWAPHHSFNKGSMLFSTFDKNYKIFLELAQKYKNIDWIVKIHPSLRDRVVNISKLMTNEEFDDYIEIWNNLPNGQVNNDGDYISLFKGSDCLITDCVSFLVEYLYTGKPLIHLINPDSVGYNEVGEKIVSTYYKSNSDSDIEKLINEVVISGNDYLKEDRWKAFEYLLSISKKNPGKEISEYIIGLLN